MARGRHALPPNRTWLAVMAIAALILATVMLVGFIHPRVLDRGTTGITDSTDSAPAATVWPETTALTPTPSPNPRTTTHPRTTTTPRWTTSSPPPFVTPSGTK